jgi:hypothetical protein
VPADDHTNAVDGTAAAGVRGPSSCLAHGKCAYSGVFTSTQYGPEAGRLHGADEPDDVQLTLAGQFALRPSMFQEVGIGEGPVVQLHGGRAGRRAHRRRPPPRRACAATDPAEFDLHKLQPAAAQRRPHLARVGPRLTCPREILDVQDRFRRTPVAAAASQRWVKVCRGGSPNPAPFSVKKLATGSGDTRSAR